MNVKQQTKYHFLNLYLETTFAAKYQDEYYESPQKLSSLQCLSGELINRVFKKFIENNRNDP